MTGTAKGARAGPKAASTVSGASTLRPSIIDRSWSAFTTSCPP